MAEFAFTEILPLGAAYAPNRLVSTDGVSQVDTPLGQMLRVEPEALTLVTQEAMRDIAHFLRPAQMLPIQ